VDAIFTGFSSFLRRYILCSIYSRKCRSVLSTVHSVGYVCRGFIVRSIKHVLQSILPITKRHCFFPVAKIYRLSSFYLKVSYLGHYVSTLSLSCKT
jgi:hypothetical protein